jgi:hypothetical protein
MKFIINLLLLINDKTKPGEIRHPFLPDQVFVVKVFTKEVSVEFI